MASAIPVLPDVASTTVDGDGQAILDRCHGIKGFDLDVHIDVGRCQPVDFNYGCMSNRFENILINHFLCPSLFSAGRCGR
jgi:hypothetical protein